MQLSAQSVMIACGFLCCCCCCFSLCSAQDQPGLPLFSADNITSSGSIVYVDTLSTCTFGLVQSVCGGGGCPGYDDSGQGDINTQCVAANNYNPCANDNPPVYNTGLHIASIFIIFGASVLGAGIPVLSKYSRHLSIHPYFLCLGKCMGIGILIACALVHMLQPSSQELTNVCLSTEFTFNYSAYAFMFAMLAILLMQFIDFTVETILITSFSRKLENNNNGGHGNGISHAHDHIVHKVDLGSTHKVPVALDVIKLGGNAHTHGVGSIHAPCVHTGLISDSDSSNLGVGFSLGLAWNIATPCEAPVEECNKGPDGGDCGAHIVEDTGVEICSRASSTPVSGLTISSPVKTTYGSPSAPSPVGKSSSLDMTADCETEEEMSHGHSHNIILLKGIKRTIAAWLLEFGVSVHSILIGLTTGIVGETRLKVLLVALCFHQFFEGIALGSRIAEADMSSHAEEGFMVFLFSVSCPVGLAIGVGLTNAINPNGATYNYAAGIFDAICAGILLYIGLVLLINDFPKDMKKYCKKSPFLKFGMFVALWTGAGLLAYIGKYL